MFFTYAIYLTFCILGSDGRDCVSEHQRIETYSLKHSQTIIKNIGEIPHYHNVGDDLIYEYAYGECAKGRQVTQHDLDFEVFMAGGDCTTCRNSSP